MHSLRPLLASATLFVPFTFTPLVSQSTSQLLERLRLTAIADSLESPGSLPFHLKAAVQLDPQYHQPAQQGTVEMWSAGSDARRITYDFPTYSATFLHTSTGDYQTPNAPPPPYLVKYLLDQALHPIPQALDPTQLKAVLQKQVFGTTSLDCITLTAVPTKPPATNTAETVNYCLDTKTSDLRLTFDISGQSTIRESIGAFRDRRVAIQLATTFTGKPVAHLHVDQLKGQSTPYPETADTTGLTRNEDEAVQVSGHVLAGSIRGKEPPVYPLSARQNHISGSVLLHAIIALDGHIKDLQVIGSPDDSLTESAMNAVRKWTYTPYLLNGKPTEVDTTITVNFNLGPRP